MPKFTNIPFSIIQDYLTTALLLRENYLVCLTHILHMQNLIYEIFLQKASLLISNIFLLPLPINVYLLELKILWFDTHPTKYTIYFFKVF